MVYGRSKLLKWMLARLRPREFDSNKQSCSELLAILLQSSPLNQQRLADANGIDVLLQVPFDALLSNISARNVRMSKRCMTAAALAQ